MSCIYLQALSETNASGLKGNTAKFHLCPRGYENGSRLKKKKKAQGFSHLYSWLALIIPLDPFLSCLGVTDSYLRKEICIHFGRQQVNLQ